MPTLTRTPTVDELLATPQPELVALFRTLPAPRMEELDGEYAGYSPDGGDPELRQVIQERMFNEDSALGYWLGKAYRPHSETHGEGYNVWRKRGVELRNLRFATELGLSHIDQRPAVIMHYGAFRNDAAERGLIDEIRKLDDGLFLGAGSFAAPEGGRTEPGCFVIAHRRRDWCGVDDPAAEVR